MSFVYLHNPKCSKSREGLKLLEEKKVKFEIREYLKNPLTTKELLELFKKLDRPISEFIRTKEEKFKELKLKGKELTTSEWAKIINQNPVLLERPILIANKKAALGRPPEDLLSIV